MANVLKKAGIQNLSFENKDDNSQLDNCTGIFSNGTALAEFGSVKMDIASQFDLDHAVYYADINWNSVLEASRKNKFVLQPVSLFPLVRRDLALLLDKAIRYSEIERIAIKVEPNLIKSVNVFDVYEGEKIEAGKKSYAISLVLGDEQKTHTDTEIDSVVNKLVKEFEKKLGAILRS